MEIVSDRKEDIQAKCGCITLKGVLHHYIYDNGYHSDMVEMIAPYPGKKRALFDHTVNVVRVEDNYTPEATTLKKIYKQELQICRRQHYLERNKEKIAKLLPIWFEYDARVGYADAVERMKRRQIVRKARKGEISVKEINRSLENARRITELYRRSTTHEHTRIVNRELSNYGLKSLEFNYGDACRLYGNDIWEQLLERTEHTADVMDDGLKCLFEDFAFLYNMDLPKFEIDDVVETIGFGGEIIAVALRRNNYVVGVGAIDDVRGRRALRALVGDNRLVEILPKKVYNAITRQEPFYVRGSLYYRRLNRDNQKIEQMREDVETYEEAVRKQAALAEQARLKEQAAKEQESKAKYIKDKQQPKDNP